MPLLFVVDDNVDLCRMMARMLSRLGYEVKTFASGPQLLEHIRGTDALPDLLILDYMMPGMDGCEVLLQIRTDVRTRALPAVFYTAVDDERDFARMRSCGADDCWIKSRVDLSTIESNVRQLLLSRASGEGRVQFFFKPGDQDLRGPQENRP
jgi:CheY-like chemotaxis protein